MTPVRGGYSFGCEIKLSWGIIMKAGLHHKLFAGLAFIASVGLGAVLINHVEQTRVQQKKQRALDVAIAHGHVLQQQIDRACSATYALAAMVRRGGGKIHNFEALSKEMLPFYTGVSSLQLAPHGIVSQIAPGAGNEAAFGHDLLNDPRLRKEALAAIESRKLTLAGPFELVQGEISMVGWLPVFLPDPDGQERFWGFTIVAMKMVDVFQAATLQKMARENFYYELARADRAGGQRVTFARSGQSDLVDPVAYEIDVPNGKWTLAIVPAAGWHSYASLTAELIMIMLASLLAAFLSYRMLKQPLMLRETVELRTRELRETNQRLQSEIAARERVGAALSDVMLEYQATLDNAFNGVALLKDRKLLKCNRRLEEMFGYQPGQLLGASTEHVWYQSHESWKQMGKIAYAELAQGKPYQGEQQLRRKDGSLFWCHISGLAIDPANPMKGSVWRLRDITERKQAEEVLQRTYEELENRVMERTAELSEANVALNREIAERKRAEEALRQSNEKLRQLSSHLESVREAERARIAREIHDELGATLTALKMDLSWCVNNPERTKYCPIDRITEAMTLVDSAIQAVKKIATDLRPSILDHLGLWAAIEWLAQEINDRTGIQCEVVLDPRELASNINHDRATALFRITQEALTNVVRHAQASHVCIHACARQAAIDIEIRDNGRGITAAEIRDAKSWGILGMSERTRFFGGELRIDGAPEKGTTVSIRLPLGGSA